MPHTQMFRFLAAFSGITKEELDEKYENALRMGNYQKLFEAARRADDDDENCSS